MMIIYSKQVQNIVRTSQTIFCYFCQTPVLGLGLGVDFTFAVDNNHSNDNNDNHNHNANNTHLNFLKGTVLGTKE